MFLPIDDNLSHILYIQMLKEINRTQAELNQQISEVGRLRVELQRRDRREPDNNVEKLTKIIASLEEENRNIKVYIFLVF